MSIVGCNRSTARALLMHFRWNVDTLCGELKVCQHCLLNSSESASVSH